MVFRRESLIRRLEKLKEYHNDLESYGSLSFQEYIADKKNRYAIERILFLSVENILDFLDHILSAKYSIVSDGYENILENAFKRMVIDEKTYRQLQGLGGFRNVLAHEYLSIDDEEVYRNFVKMRGILPELIAFLDKML